MLEPHPSLPVLATSGLDDEVKIWLPTNNATLDWKEVEKVLFSYRYIYVKSDILNFHFHTDGKTWFVYTLYIRFLGCDEEHP